MADPTRINAFVRLPVADAHAIEWWAGDDQEPSACLPDRPYVGGPLTRPRVRPTKAASFGVGR